MDRLLSSLRSYARALFARRRMEAELDEELAEHIRQQTEINVAAGMSAVEARRHALIAFGGVAQRKEECRDSWGTRALEQVAGDLRFGFRSLAKARTFTAAAVITLALAIAANTVVFGVFQGLILNPLDVPRAGSLYGTVYSSASAWQSYPNYRDLRARNRSFEDLAAFAFAFVGLDTGNDPRPAGGFAVTGNYFDVLGIQPQMGRFIHAADERGPNSAPLIVLSHEFWLRRLAGDVNVIGRKVRINHHPFEIIGVAPPGFRGTLRFVRADFFIPIVNQEQTDGQPLLDNRASQGIFEIFGHLKAGVTPAQAEQDVRSIGESLAREYPGEFGHNEAHLERPGLTSFGGAAKAFLAALMGLAALILLAACANLGSLFAAHASVREREVALRLALGATRARVAGQSLVEALLISLAGGVVGSVLGGALLNQLSTWQPFSSAPVRLPVEPGPAVYGVGVMLAIVSAALLAWLPVRQALAINPHHTIKAGSGAKQRGFGARDMLLAAQVAICALLVTASLVAVRGLARSLYGQTGLDTRNSVLAGLNLAMAGYRADSALAAGQRILDRVAAIPGVESAGFVNHYPPLAYGAGTRTDVYADEVTQFTRATVALSPYEYGVSPGYFRAAGTHLLAGRDFDTHDDAGAPPVAVVNRTFAAQRFGSVERALDGHFRLKDRRVRVVGVVEDGKYQSLTESQQACVFVPWQQAPATSGFLVVRATDARAKLASAVRSVVREMEPALPIETTTWDQTLAVVQFPARVAAIALGALGVMGALLSIAGVFAMATFSVTRRLKELGIRRALGAGRHEILGAALGRAVNVLAAGSVAGVTLGLAASKVLASIVYQATPRDPLVLAGVVIAMTLIGVLATWLPARRALLLDPSELLREE